MKKIVWVAFMIYCSALFANPAPWFKWHSAENDFDICSQTSPGDGWIIVKGPFQDAMCRKQGVPH